MILRQGHIFWKKYLLIVKKNRITFYQVGFSHMHQMGSGDIPVTCEVGFPSILMMPDGITLFILDDVMRHHLVIMIMMKKFQ